MAINETYAGSASISTTEYSLPGAGTTLQNITTDGIYQLFLDLNALTATEQYRLKLYEKVQSSSTKRAIQTTTFTGVQTDPVFVLPALLLLHGWDMTLTKLQGTDRTIEWSIRQVA